MGRIFGVLGSIVCVLVVGVFSFRLLAVWEVVSFHVHDIFRGIFTWYHMMVNLRMVERFGLSTV